MQRPPGRDHLRAAYGTSGVGRHAIGAQTPGPLQKGGPSSSQPRIGGRPKQILLLSVLGIMFQTWMASCFKKSNKPILKMIIQHKKRHFIWSEMLRNNSNSWVCASIKGLLWCIIGILLARHSCHILLLF